MKKLLILSALALTSFAIVSCSTKKESFEGAKSLMEQQIVELSNVGTLDELMSVQVKNGDTIVQLMTIIEPSLSQSQKDQLQMLNQQYNSRLRIVADSLVQLMVVDTITITEN